MCVLDASSMESSNVFIFNSENTDLEVTLNMCVCVHTDMLKKTKNPQLLRLQGFSE